MYRWDFREKTDQVYRLLHDLSQDTLLWGRFFDAPLPLIEGYGLSVPEGIIRGKLHTRRRPPHFLFASPGLDWVAFDERYLNNGPQAAIPVWDPLRASPDEATEILLTLSGTKPAARLSVTEEQLGSVIRFLMEKNIPFVVSPFKSLAELDPKKGGYSNLMARVEPFHTHSAGSFMVYVSRSSSGAQLSLLLHALGADYEFGHALGYPTCCVEFFTKNFGKSKGIGGDLVSFSLRNTAQPPPYSFYLNNLARYFGMRLIFHFPCHYACTASVAVGKRHLEALQRDAPQLAHKIRRVLLCPAIYTDTEGVFLLEECAQLSDGYLAYDPTRINATDKTTPLYRLLRAADKIKVHTGNENKLSIYRAGELVGQTDSNVWCLTFEDREEGHPST